MKIEIGAYEARTRLAELLRDVQAGRRYTITHRGQAIADLVPAGDAGRQDAGTAVAEMLQFMRRDPVRGVDLQTLIEEGRS
ncbi:MAG: type II toxin-antitoxin system Phd/YefM family antitoxin [Candidatus Binatia bacterium]